MTASNATAENPLLIGKGLPPFELIAPEQVVPAITQLIDELDTELAELEARVQPTWEGLVEPLTHMEERLSWSWGVVGHLMGVKNSPELRQAYEAVQPKLVEFSNRASQSQPIYRAYKALQDSDTWASLEPAQQRIIEAAIQSAELSGVGLEGETRDRFNAIQLELAELSTKFSNNLLDATKAFKLKLTAPDEVTGLPASALSLAAQTARQEGEESATAEAGPWVITLDYPSFIPFMQYSQRRDLRQKVYTAFVSRAASGDLDNNPVIERILTLRQEKSEILGFANFAELSLARKMAPDVAAVEALLEELRLASYDAAAQDLTDLQAFAAAKGAPEANALQQWDIGFWAERQREDKYAIDAEALRPYFPLPQVLDGLFSLAKRLFGVTIAAADGEAPVWNADVRYFRVSDAAGEAIAHFYLDPYSRPGEKRGGAWMNDCINRSKETTADGGSSTRLPVAYLICNQAPPVDGKPSLMTFEEVNTLFHEFGHGLQHMLTRIDFPGAAGINNVEWDAVELPSQFMENWCYDRQTLFALAKHYETGETLPEADYQKLLAARNYRSGTQTLRQLHFSLLDIELHARHQPG
ncbi:MAG: M3 family metallopeptidase, partial [Cyanobacteria bacterium J06641_5]